MCFSPKNRIATTSVWAAEFLAYEATSQLLVILSSIFLVKVGGFISMSLALHSDNFSSLIRLQIPDLP